MSWLTHRDRRNRVRTRRHGSYRPHVESLEPRRVLDAGLAMAELTLEHALPWTIPALESNRGAQATLYLDFNGHFEEMWGWDEGELGRNRWDDVVTPAFDLDGDPDTFSDQERDWITEVFLTVAEDYAPFDINVTTMSPGSFDDCEALRVAIGGSSWDWYGKDAGGVAFVNSFSNEIVNTVYVFAEELDSARDIADCSSHEAGHAFGLLHQSEFDAAGNITAEYGHSSADKAPVMGDHYDSARAAWWVGKAQDQDTDPIFEQDDMEVIASTTNGFGYRSDDHSDFRAYATPLTADSTGAIARQAGIVGQTYDDDWFSFMAGDGRVNFQVRVADVNPNLDVKLELWKEVRGYGGRTYVEQVDVEDPRFMLSANMSCEVTAGKYYLLVTSHGEYGDAGQYTVTGTLPQYYLPMYDIGLPEGMFLRPESFAQRYVTEPFSKSYVDQAIAKTINTAVDTWAGLDAKDPIYVSLKATSVMKSVESPLTSITPEMSYKQALDQVMATESVLWWEKGIA